jgi:hypothetical protein
MVTPDEGEKMAAKVGAVCYHETSCARFLLIHEPTVTCRLIFGAPAALRKQGLEALALLIARVATRHAHGELTEYKEPRKDAARMANRCCVM